MMCGHSLYLRMLICCIQILQYNLPMHNRLVIIGLPPQSNSFPPSSLKYCFLLLSLWLCICTSMRNTIKISSNYNASAVHSFASIALPLQVPTNTPKHSDPNAMAHTPITEKHSIGLYRASAANLDIAGLQERMVHVDYQMIYQENPPNSIFEERYNEEYHLLEIREFFINMANPSEIFTICINEIYSDCENIKKLMKKPLPICINPFTKYPIFFNLYVTHLKNREIIKSSIFFNITLKYDNLLIFNRVWTRQVKFTLLPNHLKLQPFEIRNCEHENSAVAIKNPQKFDLSFLLIHKFRKYHTNGQPLDDKFTIASQKTFRFMIEAKDSTITIYSKPVDNSDKSYPVLYVPVFCYDRVVIQTIPIGIISANHLALTYPILITSNTNSIVIVEEIFLTSTSGTVELIKSPTSKVQIQSIERFVQIASLTVRSAMKPSFKNSITIKVKYSLANSQSVNNTFEAKRTLTYLELYGAITVGENRFYDIDKLPNRQYNDTQKILYFNYSVVNKLQIPIRMERILFNTQKFRMHWFRYSGQYIFPQREKEEIMLQYVGPRQIPISPIKYAAYIEFSGGIFIPFEMMVFDKTLACLYQGKETRCSALKYINFGYQKNEQKLQMQTIIFRNFNPHNITITVNNLANLAKTHGLQLSFMFSEPFPSYTNYSRRSDGKTVVFLNSGHYINLTIEMRIIGMPLSGQTLLNISTEYETFAPKIKFNFQEGRLHFTPSTYQISHFDRGHDGTLHLLSTFQDIYQIRQIISDTVSLEFFYNQSQQYEPNQKIDIPFVYNPYRDENNLTNQCCSEEFLKNYYIHSLIYYEESNARNHEVTIITNTDYEQHLNIKVDIQKASLLSLSNGTRKVVVNALSIGNRAKVCMMIENPYPAALKYNVFFIPDAVVYKPKDYNDYFKHARRERIDAYICFIVSKRTSHLVNALKHMFKLEETPVKIQINVDSLGNIDYDSNERDNLSSNEYVNAIVQTGDEACYKINTFLYFKLLIQSEIVNALLQNHSLDAVEKFIQRQWLHMQNNSVSYIDDDFYKEFKLKFQNYCKTAVFPIFRFCLYYPITVQSENSSIIDPQDKTNKKTKIVHSHLLPSNKSEELCFLMDNELTSKKQASFELVIANNYSMYDDYKIQVSFVEPKVSVSNIAFQKDHRINHETFIKHYFSALSKASNQQLSQEGIQNRHKIIPVYLTNQDFEEQFGVFKGERFFQIENHAAKDIDFTHFGFENKENISEWAGLGIQTVDGSQNVIRLAKNNKTVFRLSLCLDQPFEFNLTNPYFHKKINLYLYNQEQFYLSLTLLLRVADNVVQKLKVSSQPSPAQNRVFIYIILNFLSFGFICIVIVSFQKEQSEKRRKMEIALQKQKKIIPHKKDSKAEPSDVGFIEQKLKKKNHILLPESIGTRLTPQQDKRYCPQFIINEEELTFFKSLKIQKDKSIISESSEDPNLKFSNEEVERSEDKSQTFEKEHEQQQSKQNSESNDPFEEHSEMQSEESQESLSESILPDGISVCNEQLDTLDEFDDFEFGFESKRSKKEEKVKKEEEVGYYDVFSNHNPLAKVETKENPFPWMNQLQKKKSHRPKRLKQQLL